VNWRSSAKGRGRPTEPARSDAHNEMPVGAGFGRR
jgi:hypothetical protein